MTPLVIAVAQINCVVGDLAGNADRILEAAAKARAAGAHLVVTPELALSGYPPEDLLLRSDFYRACEREMARIARSLDGIALIVGHPLEEGDQHFNAASLVRPGEPIISYRKHRLPNYEVFDEERYFDCGAKPCVVTVAGVRIGINICADVWEEGAADAARREGAELLVALNASPYHIDKQATRYEVLRSRIEDTGIPVIYANLVGGQDELVFDGASFALDRSGELVLQSRSFVEAIDRVTYADGDLQPGNIAAPEPIEAEIYAALRLGVADYLGKNGFPGAIVGLSGGIDSALTLCVAADALGANRVHAVMMPSPYTSRMSLEDARALAQALGVAYDEIPIRPAMDAFASMLARRFAGREADATEENIQARIRGMILMAISNKEGSIVLTTGNKSEMAVGYATLYGDMAGGFAVIKDIFKTMVYRLARYRNGVAPVIPESTLARPPTAELKPGQTDQDTLPPYEVLDAIIEAYMERDESPREIVARGYTATDVRRVVTMLKRSEYKRRQAPVGIRVTRRGFGKDWRYPITSRYADEW
ncbi:MAG: NAD+ synthase [Betaproteobacteria bacterium CG2_30_68_42]|nr:MAG: NAD+ synthase [Betaproteobacteria bacterium CG2_30_68_42]